MYQEGRYHNSKPTAKEPPAEVPFPLDVIKLESSAIKEAVLKPEDLEPLDLKQTHIPEVPPPIPELSLEEAGITEDGAEIPLVDPNEVGLTIEPHDMDIDGTPILSPAEAGMTDDIETTAAMQNKNTMDALVAQQAQQEAASKQAAADRQKLFAQKAQEIKNRLAQRDINEIAAARQKAIEKAQAAADDNQDWFEHEVPDDKQATG